MQRMTQRMMQGIAMATALWLLPASLSAQRLHFKTPGIPRTADGKPDLAAPAPRTQDGKPDLSGLWQTAPNPYFLNVTPDPKDEAIFKAAAEAVFQEHIYSFQRGFPPSHCLPLGPAEMSVDFHRIIQSSTMVALLYNGDAGDGYRQIFVDGRELPKDPNPTWRGYSVGHWEGDTLVVETAGFNDRSWLDLAGHPHSERLRVTERYKRVDFGHIQLQVTLDDPETLTRPLTLALSMNYQADTEMLEAVCEDRDSPHMVGKANEGVKLSAEVLAKYAGTYELREAPAGVSGSRPLTISLANGRLYMGGLPLIPESVTRFEMFGGGLEFSLDASGVVTGVTRSDIGGDFRYARKP
jgi:hypothetical protein